MDRQSPYSGQVPQDKTAKKSAITPLSIKVGDLLTGAYKGARMPDGSKMRQEDIAARMGMSTVTLRKKLAGDSPINTTDLVLIAGAIPGTEAGAILEAAITQLGGYDKLLSEASSTTDDLETRRMQRVADAAALAEIERLAEAALKDEQMDEQPDEPETP